MRIDPAKLESLRQHFRKEFEETLDKDPSEINPERLLAVINLCGGLRLINTDLGD